MYISSEDWVAIWLGVGSLLGLIFIIYFGFLTIKYKNEGNQWFKEQCEKLDLRNSENIIIGECDHQNFLVYTNKEYIYLINKSVKSVNKIYKSKILKADVEVYSIEKNVKKLVALTSTYTKKTRIASVTIKIITNAITYNIPCIVNGKLANDQIIMDVVPIMDTINRCKLLLDRDTQELNRARN